MAVEFSPSNMTGNSTPTPYVLTGTGELASHFYWYAYSGDTTTDFWQSTATGTFNIVLDLGSGNSEAATSFDYISWSSGTAAPKDFTLDGSNDGSAWTTLKTVTGQADAAGTFNYTFTNTTSYRYYRMNITAVWGATVTWAPEINWYKDNPASGQAGNIKLTQSIIIS